MSFTFSIVYILYSTQHGELLITFRNGNSAQNPSVGNQYGIQKITNFWLINKMILSVGALLYSFERDFLADK